MMIRKQLGMRRFGLLVCVLWFGLGLASVVAEADDVRENPPSRPRPVATRAPSGGNQGSVAVPRNPGSPGSPSTPTTRHEPPRTGGGGGSGGHGGHRYPSHYGYGLGYYGFGYYWPYHHFYRSHWGYPYYPWGLAWYPAYSVDARVGSLDLNIKPKKADVYVDGDYIGRAAKFDGWPGHLWLEAGRHELVFYYEGRETVVRNVNVQPGPVRRVRVDMVKGEPTPAEEVFAMKAPPAPSAVPKAERQSSLEAPAPRQATIDLRGEPGRFSLEVLPSDAAVYLDGRFLGSAEELSRLHAGMMVDAGDHLLEVQRPGYETERIEFSVSAGDQEELRVDLESSSGSGGAAGRDPK